MHKGRITGKSIDGRGIIVVKICGGAAMCTESQVNNISRQISQSYRFVYGDSIVAIYLYGSYARGNYTDESDIDITAIVKGDRADLQEKLKLERREEDWII